MRGEQRGGCLEKSLASVYSREVIAAYLFEGAAAVAEQSIRFYNLIGSLLVERSGGWLEVIVEALRDQFRWPQRRKITCLDDVAARSCSLCEVAPLVSIDGRLGFRLYDDVSPTNERDREAVDSRHSCHYCACAWLLLPVRPARLPGPVWHLQEVRWNSSRRAQDDACWEMEDGENTGVDDLTEPKDIGMRSGREVSWRAYWMTQDEVGCVTEKQVYIT